MEPVPATAYARFLLKWQGIGSNLSGTDRVREAVAQLEGLPMSVSAFERDLLGSRVQDYSPRWLDELGASGELAWDGSGQLGANDGRVVLVRREKLAALGPASADGERDDVADRVYAHLEERGASFFGDLLGATGQV